MHRHPELSQLGGPLQLDGVGSAVPGADARRADRLDERASRGETRPAEADDEVGPGGQRRPRRLAERCRKLLPG
jgi:hypothetical protein